MFNFLNKVNLKQFFLKLLLRFIGIHVSMIIIIYRLNGIVYVIKSQDKS